MPFIKSNRYSKGRYEKQSDEERLATSNRGKRKGFNADGTVACKSCFDLRNEIADLKAEVRRLKIALRDAAKTTKKDVENAHVPSAARLYKKKSSEENRLKVGGAIVGHKGHGRKAAETGNDTKPILLENIESCPGCGGDLVARGTVERTVVDVKNTKAERVLYKSSKQCCAKCKKTYCVKPPVLPKSLYGNNLLAHVITQHYVHGVPLGRLMHIFGTELSLGGITNAFHRVGRFCEAAMPNLIEEFRNSNVRHADETGWRTDGQSGYAWIFTTPILSLFEFADNRSSRVPFKILGNEPLQGMLVVDRYSGYNKMNVNLQYCFAHLMREVKKLSEEFADDTEVRQFSSDLIPLMALAMTLRTQAITDKEFYRRAEATELAMKKIISKSSRHLGVRRIKEILSDKEHRLYHWVKDRAVPADNNRAERELRPTVVSRKVSFGSQSIQGCKTRQAIMSVLYTAKKRLPLNVPIENWLKSALDKVAINTSLNIYDLLPPQDPTDN